MTPRPGLRAAASCSTTPARALRARLLERPSLLVAAAIATATLAGAAASTLVPALGPATSPHPSLYGTPGEVVSIAAHNAWMLLLPFVLCAGRWHTARLTGRVGDLLVAAFVASNALLVGVAVGRWPAALPPYLPHIVLEDAAVALAVGAWAARRRAPAGTALPGLARTAVLVLAVTIAAAIVETYAVPHKG